MKKEVPGPISLNLFALQLQLKTVLEEAGGESAIRFLDLVAQLGKSEQEIIFGSFEKVLKRVIDGATRLRSPEDETSRQLEESLYSEILEAIEEKKQAAPFTQLSMVKGGKATSNDSQPIDFAKKKL